MSMCSSAEPRAVSSILAQHFDFAPTGVSGRSQQVSVLNSSVTLQTQPAPSVSRNCRMTSHLIGVRWRRLVMLACRPRCFSGAAVGSSPNVLGPEEGEPQGGVPVRCIDTNLDQRRRVWHRGAHSTPRDHPIQLIMTTQSSSS